VDLTSLTYKWDPPYDGGTAILGFKIYCDHLSTEISVKRTQTTIELTYLQPNTVYAIRVAALNAYGLSEVSEPSTVVSESRTSSLPPDRPHSLKPVAGTWRSMTLEGTLPYSYCTDITSITIERRWLLPFVKGAWENNVELRIPQDVSILVPSLESVHDDESASVVSSVDGDVTRIRRLRRTNSKHSHLEVLLLYYPVDWLID
jgi:hypothetical protein